MGAFGLYKNICLLKMISVQDYTEGSIVVFGEGTIAIKDKLRGLGGRWNPRLKSSPYAGWIFPKTEEAGVRNLISSEDKVDNLVANETRGIKCLISSNKLPKTFPTYDELKGKVGYQIEKDSVVVNGNKYTIELNCTSADESWCPVGSSASSADFIFQIWNKELDILCVVREPFFYEFANLRKKTFHARYDDEKETKNLKVIKAHSENLVVDKSWYANKFGCSFAPDEEEIKETYSTFFSFIDSMLNGKQKLFLFKSKDHPEPMYALYTKISEMSSVPEEVLSVFGTNLGE